VPLPRGALAFSLVGFLAAPCRELGGGALFFTDEEEAGGVIFITFLIASRSFDMRRSRVNSSAADSIAGACSVCEKMPVVMVEKVFELLLLGVVEDLDDFCALKLERVERVGQLLYCGSR
jgi:hypothetical protein